MTGENVKDTEVLLRPVGSNDFSFIFSSWLKSFKGSDRVKHLKDSEYYAVQKSIVKDLLETCDIIIACSPEDTDQVFGYIVYKDSVVHYIYVKFFFRLFGLAKILFNTALHSKEDVRVTHLTAAGNTIRNKYGFKYLPIEGI